MYFFDSLSKMLPPPPLPPPSLPPPPLPLPALPPPIDLTRTCSLPCSGRLAETEFRKKKKNGEKKLKKIRLKKKMENKIYVSMLRKRKGKKMGVEVKLGKY